MKNITVSLDDDVYRRARVKAAEMDTSVSALVKAYLSNLSAEESAFEKLASEEREIRATIGMFEASRRLPRDDVHER